jgi:uncharacterized protein (TIGR03435 family)
MNARLAWIAGFLLGVLAAPPLGAQAPNTPSVTPPATSPNAEVTIPMGADGKPLRFDIVSFRRSQVAGSAHIDLPEDGDFIAYHGQPIQRLIYFAYFTMGTKITNMPQWVSEDLYEFRAKVSAEDVEALQSKRLVVRALLEDQLKLKLHENDKPEPVYDLIVNGTPKLKEYVDGETETITPDCVLKKMFDLCWEPNFRVHFQGYTMQNLADHLSARHMLERDIVDKTALQGRYDFSIVEIPYNAPQPILDEYGSSSVKDDVQKLGLKLVPGKRIYPGVVIDHIEQPAED